MKSNDAESITISQREGIWSTTYGPTKRLSEAFRSCSHVYLIFSVNESGGYQGFAEMMGLPNEHLKKYLFRRGKNTVMYQDNFPIEWQTIPLQYNFRNLNNFPLNPLNEYRTIM